MSAATITEKQLGQSEEAIEGLAVGEMVAVLMEYKGLIALITSTFLLLGGAYLFVATPLYRADGLIQVEEKGGAGVGSVLKDLQPLLDDGTTVAAEQEILTSRMVLGRVIKKLRLDVEATPIAFPVIGDAVVRRYMGDGVASPVLGFAKYNWGGAKISVGAFDVPVGLMDRVFTLVAGAAGTYFLLDEDGAQVLVGKVGERAVAGNVQIFVSELSANEGTNFSIIRLSPEAAIKKMRLGFSVKERGKKSGILEASLIGPDAANIVSVLDEIMNTYVRQNVDLRSAEAEKTLKFIETQLPALKKEMDAAESAYNGYRQSRGSIDLSIETQSVLGSIVELDNQLVALKQERDELRQSFTQEHPRVKAIDQRLERLKERRRQFDSEINKLPDTQQKVLQLARDVEVTTTLYTDLVNSSQQLKVTKAGTVGDVRIVDGAAAAKDPVGMKGVGVLASAALIGCFTSLIVVWIKRALRVVVEDPEVIESRLGLPVYATIPHSQEEVDIGRRAKSRGAVSELLAVKCPEDDAIECLRGLRTTIHFALMGAAHNSLLITGSSPGIGKSFISKNLGVVLAQSGKRIVIVDADLRRGHINKEFGLVREAGISEFITGNVTLEQIVKPTSVPNLWVVTTGQIPPNPSELLMHPAFESLLEQLQVQFDTLIVDAPPILAVSDAAIVGRLTGATLLVARAGRHPLGELAQSVKRLTQAGVPVKGFVFNGLNPKTQRYKYGYNGYVYSYSYRKNS